MIVYAESGAVLAWLLGEPSQEQTLDILRRAERVVASTLTGLECARGLARAKAANRISETDELAALRLLDVAESTWDLLDLAGRVIEDARGAFPVEPVRSLDAIHLATALMFQEAFGPVVMLSFDDRIRANATALGLSVAG
ncbi:MAG: type II toxin-antitoxin system VapC family toxin [Gemmatimonadota bacterium]